MTEKTKKNLIKAKDSFFVKKTIIQTIVSFIITFVMVVVIKTSSSDSTISKFVKKQLYTSTDLVQSAKGVYGKINIFINDKVIPVFNNYGDYID